MRYQKLSYVMKVASHRKLTALRSTLFNAPHWRISYNILKWSLQRSPYILLLADESIKEVILDEDEVEALKPFVSQLEKLNYATIQLRNRTIACKRPYYVKNGFKNISAAKSAVGSQSSVVWESKSWSSPYCSAKPRRPFFEAQELTHNAAFDI